jgi:hypothetical protein
MAQTPEERQAAALEEIANQAGIMTQHIKRIADYLDLIQSQNRRGQ